MLNARFREAEHPTGVQRSAIELSRRLTFAHERAPGPAFSNPLLSNLWEQCLLPLSSRPHHVVCLANSIPVSMRKKLVVLVHDVAPLDHPEFFSRAYRFKHVSILRLLRGSKNTICTVSEFTRSRLLAHGICDDAIVVGNGFEHATSIPARRPASLPAQVGDFYLTVGSMDPRKGLAELLAAWDRAGDTGKDLVIAGPPMNPSVFASCTPRSNGARVHHVGFVDDTELAWLYRNADTYVSLSTYEGFNLPPLEALANGARLLLSDIPVHRELYSTVATLVPCDDHHALVQTLTNGVQSPEHAARGEVLERSSWDACADRLSDVLCKVAA